ncbi:MAG: hypothetical protein JNK32_00075 [Anaerolineales bacterium]|nr:hypothetical protein [Anaerolineales bacterium]
MNTNKKLIAIGLGVIGIFFFLAISFDILAENIGTFVGIAFLMLSGLTWAFWPNTKNEG